MPKEHSASLHSSIYRQIGTHGWRESDYFTYSASSLPLRRWIASQLPIEKAEILSVGCGTGELEKHLTASSHRVVGLDVSHQMLKRASRGGLELPVEADARYLPFTSACFDAVLFFESIGHLPLGEAFEESRRVLRKGGGLLITTYASHLKVHPRYRKHGFDDIIPALIAAGFQIKEQRFLSAKQNSVREVSADKRATLLYVMATGPA